MSASCRSIFRILTLLLISLSSLKGQFNNFKKWSVKEGLIQSDIYDIQQDARGYLWIASGGGLMQFDGIRFTNFTKKNGLAGNVVRCIFEDKKGRLWFGTNEGVCYYDGLQFHKVTNKNFKGASALCFSQDNDENIYVGTDDGGVNVLKWRGDSIQVLNIPTSSSVLDIAIDKKQTIWLATYGDGLCKVTRNKDEYESKSISGIDKLPSDNLVCLEFKDDNLWIGSYDAGAFRYSMKDLSSENYSSPEIFNKQTGLNSNCVWDILISHDNEIWLASLTNGINRLKKEGATYHNTSFTNKEGLGDNQILSLYEDRQQNIWIGTNGNGMNMLAGDYFSHYSSADGLLSNKVQSLQQDSTGAYWIASSGRGLSQLSITDKGLTIKNHLDKTGLTDFISSVAIGKASNSNIWFGTDDNGLLKFNGTKFYNYTNKDGVLNNRIYSVYVDNEGIVWSGTADGISRFDGLKFLSISTDAMLMQDQGVKAITGDANRYIWFGAAGGLARYDGKGNLRTFDEVEGLKTKDVNSIAAHSSGDIYIGTNTGGLYKYNHLKNDSIAIEFIADDSLLLSNSIRSLQFLNDSVLIAGTFKGFDKIVFDKLFKVRRVKHYTMNDGFIGVECNDNAILLDKDKNVWFGTVNGITKYSPAKDTKVAVAPEVFITDVQLFFKDVNWESKNAMKLPWFNAPNSLTLPYNENHLTFKFHCNNFNNPENVAYKFKLEGRDKDWSPPRKNSEETFSGLEPGTYTFAVMAQVDGDYWSQPALFSFSITPPWYKTTTFYILVILFLISSVYGYIKWREKKLVKEKAELEGIVKERTHEVVTQKHLIEEKHKEITDSINYAERIQRSFLASDELLNTHLKNYFVLFKPKDVVSGDFYWASAITNPAGEDNFILATADSTGHGVPGAIMSLLNITSLEKAIEHLTDPADILNHTRQTIIKRLKKDGSAEGGKDGMDCSLIVFDFKNEQLRIAAANNPVWIVREVANPESEEVSAQKSTKELIEIKPDKMPVGKHDRDQESFKMQTISIQEGDVIYTLTDGFPDQFGGEKGKKFMSKNLKELLLANSHLPMSEQKSLLEAAFRNWVGHVEQVDDVTVIGVRV